MIEQIQKVVEMLSPDFDWDKHWVKDDAESIEDKFRKCVKLLPPEVVGDYHDCGSYKGEDTPRGLYRLLYLLEPEAVDFSNMYRGQILAFASADERFMIKVFLFEYELGLYFLAPEETIDKSEAVCVPAAWPGADNRIRCTDPAGVAFFDMVRKVVEHEYDVYPAGGFKV
jgi:hypothetical protein